MPVNQMPKLPYYAVIFTSVRTEKDNSGYDKMAKRMMEMAAQQPGFLGVESARQETGITISYWKDLDSIKNWKKHGEHIIAQKLGKEVWYAAYRIRICKVESEYGV